VFLDSRINLRHPKETPRLADSRNPCETRSREEERKRWLLIEGEGRIEIRRPAGKVLVGIYPATPRGVDNPAGPGLRVVASIAGKGDGVAEMRREARGRAREPRTRTKGRRSRVD